jgi:hypothetical protein
MVAKKKPAKRKALSPLARKRATIQRAERAAAKKRETFVTEYLFNGNNGTQAYLKIYPKVKVTSAATEAWRMLRNPDVIKLLREMGDKHHDDLVAGHKEILREVSSLALFDPANMFDEDGRLLMLHEMDPVTRKMVNEIEMVISDDDGTGIQMAKIKYGKDKKGYIDMMMKHYNQYEAHQVAGSVQPTTVWLHEADANL